MRRKLEITPEAERDIAVVVADMQRQNGINSTRQTLVELRNHLNSLAELHDNSRDGGYEGTKEAVMTGLPYIAIYKISGKQLTIVRILYAGPDRRKSKR